MTFLPIASPWVFWPLAVLFLAGAALLVQRGPSAARWRYAALVLLVVLAGARPGFSGAPAPVATTELNVYFVLDMTPSSSAEDYHGNAPRLEGMRADIMALATELAGARFSLISFDSSAKVLLPLTTDTTALRTLTEVTSPRSAFASQGSSISVANELLAQRLAAAQQSHPNRPRLVYYLGDGEQTAASAPESFKAAAALTDGGAVLGYGTAAGGTMRDYTFGRGTTGPYILDKADGYQPAVSMIDETSLQNIASELNVPYVHRAGVEGIGPALEKSAPLAATQQAGQDERAGAGRWEVYWVLALAAFGILLWELAELTRSWSQVHSPRKGGRA